jgi:anthranilate phosphoribosyltransferase
MPGKCRHREAILPEKKGPKRDIVLLNAAFALVAREK